MKKVNTFKKLKSGAIALLVTAPVLMHAELVTSDLGSAKGTIEAILNQPLVNGGIQAGLALATIGFMGKGSGLIGGQKDMSKLILGIISGAVFLSYATIKAYLLGFFVAA